MRLKYFIAYTNNVDSLKELTLACIAIDMYNCNLYKFNKQLSQTKVMRLISNDLLLSKSKLYLDLLKPFGSNDIKIKNLKDILRDSIIFNQFDYPSRLSIILSFKDNPLSFRNKLYYR